MKIRIQPLALVSLPLLPALALPLILIACCGAEGQMAAPKAAAAAQRAPMSFEANAGQADGRVQFLARGAGYGLFLTGQDAVLALHGKPCAAPAQPGKPLSQTPRPSAPAPGPSGTAPCRQDTTVVTMHLDGMAKASAAPLGEDELPGKVNYFVGNDPVKWRTGAATFAKVRYRGVYPGVDLVYYGNQRQLEYDFIVAPGADASPLRLSFTGGTTAGLPVGLGADGNLTVSTGSGKLALQRPLIYQTIDGQRRPVDGSFALLKDNAVGFRIGSYDHTRPLVIDPVLVYSTYLSGNGYLVFGQIPENEVLAVTSDALGNTYAAGYTYAADFPVSPGTFESQDKAAANQGGGAFVTEFDPNGGLVFSTYLGGSGFQQVTSGGPYTDQANTIAVDATGIYVAGSAVSTDFPTTTGAFQRTVLPANQGSGGLLYTPKPTGFVTKLAPGGAALLYSTYLGGSGQGGCSTAGACEYFGEEVYALAVDAAGDAFVGGSTYSTDFPITSGAFQIANHSATTTGYGSGSTGFVTKLNPAGSAPVYSTYLGGTANDSVSALQLDAGGYAYVAGTAASSDFPVTTGAFQTTRPNPHGDAFVAKLNPAGSALLYSTYLGGSGGGGPADSASALQVDATGNVYIVGSTSSANFPVTTGAFQTVNKSQVAYVSSATNAFLAKLNGTGSALLYATYLGGSDSDSASALAIDAAGNAYVAGQTFSHNFPVTSGALQPTTNDSACNANLPSSNGFVTKVNPQGTALLYSTYFGGSNYDDYYGYNGDGIIALALDAAGKIYIGGRSYSTDFPLTYNAFQSTPNSGGDPYSGFVAKLDLTATSVTPTVTVSPASYSGGASPLTVTANVHSPIGGATPTGTILLEAAAYDGSVYHASAALANGSTQITIPANALAAATYCLIARYTPDAQSAAAYNPGLGEGSPSVGVQVTVGTQPAGVSFSVDGTTYTSPQTFNWNQGDMHTLATTSPQTAAGTMNTFSSWSDGGALSHTITVSPSNTAYTAIFTTSYQLTTSANPVGGGTAAPVSGSYYSAGTAVPLHATANSGYTFTGWTGPVASAGSAVTTITMNAPETVVANFAAYGASLTPGSLTFTAVNGATSAAQTAMLSNTGNATLTITGTNLTGTNPTNFAIGTGTNACGSTLAANVSCLIYITFSPNAVAGFNATLSVADNATGSPQTVTLTGTGTAAPAPLATLTPGALTFTAINGATSVAQTATLSNTGNATLNIAGINLTGANAANFAIATGTNACGSTLAANASCFIYITFTPNAVTGFAATLSVTDNATGSPQTVMLTGTGTPPPAPIAALTSAIAFPNTTQGQTSAAMTATLSNTGNATLNIAGIVLGGSNAADFALVTSTSPCGSTLAAGASCLIAATFTPQGASTYNAAITVTDNAATPTQTTALTGTGLAAVASDFTLTASSAAQTVLGGNSVQYVLSVTPTGGPFNGVVTFSAAGLPPGATAVFAPPTLTPGSSPASSTVTIATVQRQAYNHTPAPWLPPAAMLAAFLPVFLWSRRRLVARHSLASFALAAWLGTGALFLSGCGSSGFTLPAVTYNVTLTATSGAITHSTIVTLTVQ